jgi:hypothetical protein
MWFCTIMSVRAATGLDILLPTICSFLSLQAYRLICLLFLMHELAK